MFVCTKGRGPTIIPERGVVTAYLVILIRNESLSKRIE